MGVYTYSSLSIFFQTYAYSLCNRAWSINSTTTESTFEENSKQTAHFLRLAAGVYSTLLLSSIPYLLHFH